MPPRQVPAPLATQWILKRVQDDEGLDLAFHADERLAPSLRRSRDLSRHLRIGRDHLPERRLQWTEMRGERALGPVAAAEEWLAHLLG